MSSPPRRPATLRVDPLLVVACALASGAFVVAAPAPALGAAFVIFAVLLGRVSRALMAVALIAFAGGGVRAEYARRTYELEHARILDELGAPARCAGIGRVLSSPTRRDDKATYVAEFAELDCEGRALGGPLSVRIYSSATNVMRGDERSLVMQLAPVQLFRNFGVNDPTWRAVRTGAVLSGSALADDLEKHGDGLGALVDRAREHSRERIERTFVPTVVPLAKALVLGENDLEAEDDAAFKKSGLSHLLAVSGTHLVFAVLMLVRALGFVLLRFESLAARFDVARLAAALGALLALLYADFAGGSGSAWRAAYMLSAALFVRALGRRPSVARSVAASLIAGSAFDPLVAFDGSFLLSAAATAGLVLLGQRFQRLSDGVTFWPLRYFTTSILTTLAAMIPCAPLLMLLSPHQTLAGIFANVVAAPLGEVVALPLSLGHSLLGWAPSIEQGAALIASGALLVVRAVARLSAGFAPLAWSAPLPTEWQLAVLAAGAALFFVGSPLGRGSPRGDASVHAAPALSSTFTSRSARLPRLVFGAAVVVLTLILLALLEQSERQSGAPRDVLRVTMLDVGQGDALLVDFPDGRVMLVDGGGFVGSSVDPGASVILPALRARRRTELDVMLLSHPHPDHFLGFVSVAKAVRVHEFWDTGQGAQENPAPAYLELLAALRAQGTRIRRPSDFCHGPHEFGGAVLTVLAPCPNFREGRGANDNSLVVRVSLGTRSVLLTGDAEEIEEGELARDYGSALKADLLKVGHHGSRTSSQDEFLEFVRPELAFVSTGVRNRFGHPHAPALERLEGTHALVERTDQRGSLEWATDGRSVWYRSFEGVRATRYGSLSGI